METGSYSVKYIVACVGGGEGVGSPTFSFPLHLPKPLPRLHLLRKLKLV